MKATYSIISFVNNPVSQEKIAVGLIVFHDSDVYLKFSNKKIGFAKKLNAKAFHLLSTTVKKLESSITNTSYEKLQRKGINQEFLFYLKNYEQGILQFSEPKLIETENANHWDEFFIEWIDKSYSDLPAVASVSPQQENKALFKAKLERSVLEPLKGRININYRIKKREVPALIFDYDLDAIGANGSLVIAKSIDFKNDSTSKLESDIVRYEFLLDCLIPFSESRLGLNSDHDIALIVNPPDVRSKNYEIYERLKHQEGLRFKVWDVEKSPGFTNLVANKTLHKFSEII